MTTPILVDDVPAEIRGFVRVVDEVPISVPVGRNLNPIIRRPDIETSQRDDVIGHQFRQIGAIDPVKDVKIDGAPRHRTGASSSIDHAELDSQRLIIGPFAMIPFEDADGVHDQERPMRGDRWGVSRQRDLPTVRSNTEPHPPAADGAACQCGDCAAFYHGKPRWPMGTGGIVPRISGKSTS
jgi:hypothetical protein